MELYRSAHYSIPIKNVLLPNARPSSDASSHPITSPPVQIPERFFRCWSSDPAVVASYRQLEKCYLYFKIVLSRRLSSTKTIHKPTDTMPLSAPSPQVGTSADRQS
jgi:hypothetical protein